MKLKSAFYQGLWYIVRSLVHTKRGLVFIFLKIGRAGAKFFSWYKRTFGFVFFKLGFYARRRLFADAKGVQFFRRWLGERWVLQTITFLICFGLALPHTKLYKPDFGVIAGKNTLIYALVGPGEQDFAPSDDIITETALLTPSGIDHWGDGAIIAQPQNQSGTNNIPDDITGTTIDGSFVKPLIISTKEGPIVATPPSNQIDETVDRRQVIEYQVKQGDVLGGIAHRYGLTVTTILAANHLTERSLIRPGDVLKIPAADGVLHTITKGETITKIAKLYGVKPEDVLKFNHETEKSLKVGTQILIPGAKKLLDTTTIAKNKPIIIKKPAQKPATQENIDRIEPVFDNHPSPVLTSGYIWPTQAKIITQYYGLQHTGMDIAGPIGLSNYAARAGQVVKAQCGWNGGYGCYIILDHGGGVQTLYGHNSKLLVTPGEYVEQGQVIGLLGSTGRSTGPHLHFEVRLNGHRTNPLQFIRR